MKCAKVFPIFKEGNKSDPSNYRPISMLSNISKKMKDMSISILLNTSLFMNINQAFVKKHSCQTAPVKLIDQWMSCIDKGDRVGTLFLDLRKAFDFVDHSILIEKVIKSAKIRNRCNQVPDLTQDTNGKVTNSQLDITNKSKEVSPFPAGDHKAHINRRRQRHSKRTTEQKHKRSTKEVPPGNSQ